MTAESLQPKTLSGQTAIVTGAGTGIGQGIAIAYAKAGANVVIVGRTMETLKETSKAIEPIGRVHCIQGSVAERDTAARVVAETIERFRTLDILVNNAHTFSDNLPFDQVTEEVMRRHMESGLFGTYYFMQAAFPHMRERGGSIINLGSIAGVQGWANFAPYAAAKEAIRGMSRSASRDWGKHKIRVNVIVPSARSKIWEETFTDPEAVKALEATIPLGYIGDPELDVGGVAVFLASEAARYVTGQTMHVSGGM